MSDIPEDSSSDFAGTILEGTKSQREEARESATSGGSSSYAEQLAQASALLKRHASGEAGLEKEVVRAISDLQLYAPAIADDEDSGSIRLVTFTYEGKEIVPAFTESSTYENWSQGEYECFPVIGADLALTLPEDVWLFVDPGYETNVTLSPEQVASLTEDATYEESTIAANTAIFDAPEMPESSPLESVFEEASPRDNVERNASATIMSDPETTDVESTNPEAQLGSQPETEVVEVERMDEAIVKLKSILSMFPEVLEGYFIEAETNLMPEETCGVLGLLTKDMKVEKRFSLIDKVAEISRTCFGAAGAIEVFDDLNLTSSSSWQLFNAQAPFYVNEKNESF